MSESQLTHFNWLAFSTAFENHLGLVSHLRDNNHTPEKIGQLLSEHMAQPANVKAESELSVALYGKLSAQKLARLHSDPVRREAEKALSWEQKRPDHHLICLDNPKYPRQLLDTANPPTVIYAKGSLAALQPPAVAIVGARKASHTAIRRTREFAAELSQQGLCIVSGLAMGVDAAAHLGSLEKNGITIAVAATEPETVYPKRHQLLNNRIIDSGGLVLTENPLEAPTLKWHFPRRNRIISGLSAGVLVTEAALPSGSLTTAMHALEQGRDVMAIPGSIDDPLSRGCHALIKQGAALVETPSDILDALGQQVRDQLTVGSGRKNSYE
ncbi:MAG: DNA-processing protein DprA, partial [Granulosicoccus sp.]